MSKPSKDVRRILAEMERHLALDDPELAARMDALNDLLAGGADGRSPGRPRDGRAPDDGRTGDGNHTGDDSRADDDRKTRDWRWTVAIVLGVLAVLGMILVGVFTKPPPGDDRQGRPQGSSAVSVSVLTRRPVAGPGDRQGLRPPHGSPAPRSPTERPEGGRHART
ncbi:DUF3040 domain-containing protein [Streptomyces halobius]|uniref:DUF3040 domain-containing protein n=1 Tax=Streptomyces halobius TaxID=2879846 RepID=A0ABY4M8H6_9ACTN|nr:DUF3040 domain-containing protein [Streptomyces halobius]UQA94084.1 DUF3040 domain-containing protein [Streptomyces halobius]